MGFDLEEGLYDDEVEEDNTVIPANQDIYCCPLCYADSVEDIERIGYSDPMDIIPAKQDSTTCWCFLTLDDVKDHIRNGHGLDLSVMEGDDLFYRFQLCASEGLIDQHLKCIGAMSKSKVYWTPIVNRSFNNLVSTISMRRGGVSLHPCKYKTNSKTWRTLIKPYLQSTNFDFIDNSGNSGNTRDDLKPMPMLEADTEEHKEESLIECYHKMIHSRGGASIGSSNNSYGGGGESVDDGEEIHTDYNVEDDGGDSIESEEDEWSKKKKERPSAARRAAKRKSEFQQFLKQQSSVDSLDADDSNWILKRRRIKLDTDEES